MTQTFDDFADGMAGWEFAPETWDERDEMPGAKEAEQRYYEAVDQAMDMYEPEEC